MDALLDEERDLKFANGDFAIGDSTEQDIELILISSPGTWKQSPTLGVNILKFIRSENSTGLLSKIQEELALEGFLEVQIETDTNGYPTLIQAN